MKNREPRRKVMVRARMRTGADWGDVVIHNMSSRGLLATAERPCKPGTVIEIRRVHHIVIGRVVWVKDQYFGVRTQDRIDIDAILEAKPPAHRPGAAPCEKQADADRRATARKIGHAHIADQAERSRLFASVFQSCAIGAAVIAASLLIAQEVGGLLSRPMATVGAYLEGGPRSVASAK